MAPMSRHTQNYALNLPPANVGSETICTDEMGTVQRPLDSLVPGPYASGRPIIPINDPVGPPTARSHDNPSPSQDDSMTSSGDYDQNNPELGPRPPSTESTRDDSATPYVNYGHTRSDPSPHSNSLFETTCGLSLPIMGDNTGLYCPLVQSAHDNSMVLPVGHDQNDIPSTQNIQDCSVVSPTKYNQNRGLHISLMQPTHGNPTTTPTDRDRSDPDPIALISTNYDLNELDPSPESLLKQPPGNLESIRTDPLNSAAPSPSQWGLNWFHLPPSASYTQDKPPARNADVLSSESSGHADDGYNLSFTPIALSTDTQDRSGSNISPLLDTNVPAAVMVGSSPVACQVRDDSLDPSSPLAQSILDRPAVFSRNHSQTGFDLGLHLFLMQPSDSSESVRPDHPVTPFDSAAQSPSQWGLRGFHSPSIPLFEPPPATSSIHHAHNSPSKLDESNSNNLGEFDDAFGLGLSLDKSPSGSHADSSRILLSPVFLATPSTVSQDIPSPSAVRGSFNPFGIDSFITITVDSNLDGNRDQVDLLKMSCAQDRQHFGLVLDVLDSTNVHHLDHLWEDLLEDGGEYLGLCSSLEILLPEDILRPSDGLAAEDLCTRLQSHFGAVRRFSWRGHGFNLTTPWNWREILPFQMLTSLKLDCQLSIDDGVDILYQCSELTDCELTLGDVHSVLTHEAAPLEFHGALQRLTIFSSVGLKSLFKDMTMSVLQQIDLRLAPAAAQEIGVYHIPWKGLKHTSLHCLLADMTVREIRGRCSPYSSFHHKNLVFAC